MKKISLLLLFLFIITSCGKQLSENEKIYYNRFISYRQKKDSIMQFSPDSPFNKKGKVEFHSLNYFEPNVDWVFYSKLYEYEKKDTVTVFSTKGDERKNIRYGYVLFEKDNKTYKLNVYKGFSKTGEEYYTCWFTDLTTGKSTYEVGRYLNFKKHPDKEHIYPIDFNYSFNPYCAYTKNYACTIPLKEDYIDLKIEAGEKKFHN